ncbi:MAG: hypothetical protein Q4B14_05500 [Clostridia bacterium]|nr:hypothetical protein [Clostridia bacterium]
MNIYDYLDNLEEIVDSAWTMPFNGKAFIEVEAIREAIDNIRSSLPNELSQAKIIVRDRKKILDETKSKAEAIIHQAKNKANLMISKEEITKASQKKAANLLATNEAQVKQIKKAANDYVDEILKQTEAELLKNLNDFRQIRKNIHSTKK